jgi:small subunit ribosomal protein S19
MSRSSKKGPYIDPKILKKVSRQKPDDGKIKVYKRASEISPEMVGYSFMVHNGRGFVDVKVTEEMVGYKFGEFAPTRKFIKHGGKIQRELEQKAAQAELEAKKAGAQSDKK